MSNANIDSIMASENCINVTAEDKEYTLKHLPIHLIESGMITELQQLMEDKDFLQESAKFSLDWANDIRVKAALVNN